jgi:hypothetical protein
VRAFFLWAGLAVGLAVAALQLQESPGRPLAGTLAGASLAAAFLSGRRWPW